MGVVGLEAVASHIVTGEGALSDSDRVMKMPRTQGASKTLSKLGEG